MSLRFDRPDVVGTEACEGYEPWGSRGPLLGSWERFESYTHDIVEVSGATLLLALSPPRAEPARRTCATGPWAGRTGTSRWTKTGVRTGSTVPSTRRSSCAPSTTSSTSSPCSTPWAISGSCCSVHDVTVNLQQVPAGWIGSCRRGRVSFGIGTSFFFGSGGTDCAVFVQQVLGLT